MKTPSDSNVSPVKPWIFMLGGAVGLLLAGACDGKRGELREWQPSDHQPPAAVETTGQGEGSEGGADSRVKAAQALWTMRCATCHGGAGKGDGEARPPGAQMPDLSSAAYQDQHTDEQLAEIIVKGKGLMPAFGDQLTPAGIAAVIGHIRTLRSQ